MLVSQSLAHFTILEIQGLLYEVVGVGVAAVEGGCGVFRVDYLI